MEKTKPFRRNAVEVEAAAIPTQEKRLRVLILGASRVGKTQLVSRFLGRPFTDSYIPTIEDFHRLKYIINGHTYQLDVLDTSGQTLNPTVQNLTLLTGDLFLVLYSIADRETWNRAKEIVTEIEQITSDAVRTSECIARNFKASLVSDGGNIQHEKFANGILEQSKSSMYASPIKIFLIGNKCDLSGEEVGLTEAETWLNQREHVGQTKVEHVRISAKNNYMIQGLFDEVFNKSNLPIELGPNRHRRVTATDYSLAVSHLDNLSRIDAHEKDKPGKVVANAQTSNGLNGERNRTGTYHSKKEELNSTMNAIALLCPSERRPSIDTEVLLAISKVRSVVCEPDVTPLDSIKVPSSSSKVKKQLCKLTGLVLH